MLSLPWTDLSVPYLGLPLPNSHTANKVNTHILLRLHFLKPGPRSSCLCFLVANPVVRIHRKVCRVSDHANEQAFFFLEEVISSFESSACMVFCGELALQHIF